MDDILTSNKCSIIYSSFCSGTLFSKYYDPIVDCYFPVSNVWYLSSIVYCLRKINQHYNVTNLICHLIYYFDCY